MTRTISYIVDTTHPLFAYLDKYSLLSNNLYNATTFHIRQVFTGINKETPTENEKEVLDLIRKTLPKMNATRVAANKRRKEKANGKTEPKISSLFEMPNEEHNLLSNTFLYSFFQESKNPDYLSDLPKQSAQNIVKKVRTNFLSFFAALRTYKANPAAFTGRPKMPGYKKPGGKNNIIFTNQGCVIKEGNLLKFPKTNETLVLGNALPNNAKLKQVEAIPYYGKFKVIVVFDDRKEKRVLKREKPERVIGIDFGVNNLAAISNNIGKPGLLYKGGVVKSENQWFNKKRAKILHGLTAGHGMKALPPNKKLDRLSAHRDGLLRTELHTVAKSVISYCETWNIDTIVMGVNKGWKQETNMGDVNNQNFVSIPFFKLQSYIRYLAEERGIAVIEQEESYTSKASFLDGDFIPVYGEPGSDKCKFSGVRIK